MKKEAISLTPHCHFHPLHRHRHLDINKAIPAESSPLDIASILSSPPSFKEGGERGGEVNFDYLPWRGKSEKLKKGVEGIFKVCHFYI